MRPAANCESRDVLRWTLCACLALTAHVTIAVAASYWHAPTDQPDASGAFVLDLAPLAVARADVPSDLAPGPEQTQSEAIKEKRIEKVEEPHPETPPAVEPEPAVPVPIKREVERQPEEQAPQTPVPTTSVAQVASERTAAVAAAPTQGEPRSIPSDTLPNWTNKVVAALERNKRYPTAARDRHEQGVTQLSFSIDRAGKLISSEIARSSGSAALDTEALDLLRRAQPFPPPPSELRGEQIRLSVPIRFHLR